MLYLNILHPEFALKVIQSLDGRDVDILAVDLKGFAQLLNLRELLVLVEIMILVNYSIFISLGGQNEDRVLLFYNWVTYIFVHLGALLILLLKALDFRQKPCSQNEKNYGRELQEIYIFALQ